MSVENGKCPSCGGALLLDNSKEKVVCKYCGHEIVIQQAVQKCRVDGIVDFDTFMLKAERAIQYDEDFDKARKNYKEALELRPDDFKALWGLFLCEVDAIRFAKRFKGYVVSPGDIPRETNNIIKKYGNRAYDNAPEDVRGYYLREMKKIEESLTAPPPKQKQGCYIATAVYGSYDCPEVWVLRRYRDNKLDETAFGRAFIKFYYSVSPTIVKWFGKSKTFNRVWRKYLDKKIFKLRALGYDDVPYNDKY